MVDTAHTIDGAWLGEWLLRGVHHQVPSGDQAAGCAGAMGRNSLDQDMPTKFGYPSKKPRILPAVLNRNQLHCVGPSTPQEVQLDFLCIFGRRVVSNGDIFLIALDETVRESHRVKLANRHIHCDVASSRLGGFDFLSDLSLPGLWQHIECYNEISVAKQDKDGCFIADLDH